VRCWLARLLLQSTWLACFLGRVLVVVDCNGRLFDSPLHPCGSGALSKTRLTGETALAVDLVRSPRQALVAGECNRGLQDQRHLSIALASPHPPPSISSPLEG
jgi:hypothetical protein